MNTGNKTREQLAAELARLRQQLAGARDRLDLLESARPTEATRAAQLEQDLRLAGVLADAATKTIDLRDVSRLLAREIQHVFDSHSVNLYVISPDGNELEMLNVGLTPGIVNAAERILKVKIPLIRIPRSDESTLWKVIDERVTRVRRSAAEVAAILQEFAASAPETLKRLHGSVDMVVNQTIRIMALECAVHIPLYSGDQPVGLLAVASREQMTDEDVDRLESIAQHVASILSAARIEQQWRRERERADRYMQAAPGFMLIIDTEGRVQAISRAGCEILGLPEERIIGRDWAESFVPERVRESARRRVSAVLAGGPDEIFDGHALTAQGEERLVRWRTSPLKDSSGQTTGVFASGTDLTRVSESEEREFRNRRRFRALLENSTDLTFILDARGAFTYVGMAGARALGYAPEELLGTQAAKLVYPEDIDGYIEALGLAMASPGPSRNNSLRVMAKDGSVKTLEGVANMQLDNPDVRGLILNLRDVSERERMEGSIENSAARFRALVENSQELMMVLSPELVVRYASPACSRDLGYTTEALQGVSFEELVHGADLDRKLFQTSDVSVAGPHSVRMRLRTENRRWIPYRVVVTNRIGDPAIQGFVINATQCVGEPEAPGSA